MQSSWWDRTEPGRSGLTKSRFYRIRSDLSAADTRAYGQHLDLIYAEYKKRLGGLGGRVQRSIELLNATMSVAIQSQNQAVLDTILRTAVSTYRLQETVEGLSIIAMTYYGLGILGYVFEAFHEELPLAKPIMMTTTMSASINRPSAGSLMC